MNQIVIIFSVFITVTVLAIALVFHLQKNIHSNFGCYPDDIGAIRPRTTCVLNPLRDKTPEQIAEDILQELRNKRTDVIKPYLREFNKDNQERILENESKLIPYSWRIGDRKDSDSNCHLMYWVMREGYQDYEESVSFVFVRTERGWKLQTYNAIY